jgi:kumamolisin
VAVPVNGAKNDPKDLNATSQVMMDIEVVGNIAPKANIRVYFAPWGAAGFVAAIGQAVTDKVSVLHTSWGESESEWKDDEISHVNKALEGAARRGITITAPVGDDGVTDGEADNRPHVTFPASSPWVLAVGGTSIILNSGQLSIRGRLENGHRFAHGRRWIDRWRGEREVSCSRLAISRKSALAIRWQCG